MSVSRHDMVWRLARAPVNRAVASALWQVYLVGFSIFIMFQESYCQICFIPENKISEPSRRQGSHCRVFTFQNVSRKLRSNHRVAMTTLWHTFHHDGKISPVWWGRGVHSLPLSLYLLNKPSCVVRSSWEGRHTPPISSLPLSPLWVQVWIRYWY